MDGWCRSSGLNIHLAIVTQQGDPAKCLPLRKSPDHSRRLPHARALRSPRRNRKWNGATGSSLVVGRGEMLVRLISSLSVQKVRVGTLLRALYSG